METDLTTSFTVLHAELFWLNLLGNYSDWWSR